MQVKDFNKRFEQTRSERHWKCHRQCLGSYFKLNGSVSECAVFSDDICRRLKFDPAAVIRYSLESCNLSPIGEIRVTILALSSARLLIAGLLGLFSV